MTNLLSAVCAGDRASFAVLSRSEKPCVEVFAGSVVDRDTLGDIPLTGASLGPEVLAAVPFRQITERGFDCHDDRAPLRCLLIEEHEEVAMERVLPALPGHSPRVRDAGFATADQAYADIVAKIIESEISRGAGANFVIRRDYVGAFDGGLRDAALALLRRLLEQEIGSYWTFCFVTPELALVGATPERHVSAERGEVLMNPISGTYRHGESGNSDPDSFLRFLADGKETEELSMVVDEELKMMASVCEEGGQVLGPYLKHMGHLTHTEYLLRGRSDLDVRQILRQTMFAPTVTGSPVQNAARIITRYEPGGRGYYSGVLALLGSDEHGQTLDAPILIRTCELSADGMFKASVGATLVRDSDPAGEVAETYAKLGGIRQALGTGAARPAGAVGRRFDDVRIASALSARNATLAPFWTERQGPPPAGAHEAGRRLRVLIVNAEDEWTGMLAHQVRSLGMVADVCPWTAIPARPAADVVVSGPGPGDPTDSGDPRIAALRALIVDRIGRQLPLLAVCLSHQVLAAHLDIPIVKLPRPHQGTQLAINLFGRPERVGFYNSFAATVRGCVGVPDGVEVEADPDSGVVHGVRGPAFASVQFHAESILTTHGTDILNQLISHTLRGVPRSSPTAGTR